MAASITRNQQGNLNHSHPTTSGRHSSGIGVAQLTSFADGEAERIGDIADARQARGSMVGRLVSLDLLLGDAESRCQLSLTPPTSDPSPHQQASEAVERCRFEGHAGVDGFPSGASALGVYLPLGIVLAEAFKGAIALSPDAGGAASFPPEPMKR